MVDPFRESSEPASDEDLLSAWIAGNRAALECLLSRHQPWIFNIAVRMLWRHADAEDATQDILIKVLRGLPEFRGHSRFRTWLYRIAVNHILNLKKDKWHVAERVCSFEQASRLLEQTPDYDPPDPRTVPVPIEILAAETGTSCMIGTLLCLDGRQRLVFVLGEVFGVNDRVGAEIAAVTPANFRQILSRARRDLYEFLRGNCSLVNPAAPCKCGRKTRAFIEGGCVDAERRQFTSQYRHRVREVADERSAELTEMYMKTGADVYREHPFYEPAQLAAKLSAALQDVSIEDAR